ncbi:hypothetical protein [Tenacibaculum maritimum]|uniref:hypothetical protein n=1 Tax=Tenacibaculum maritimum TaxID=107401 RepID=UPI0012E6EBB8|nr:hypothetical protein [Tenacibaculum maritimum]MCD9581248.1 hypothetical protein [Tenacibaculum maritimum]MCD9635225.1 hypothetical protein [Tenacibaculum maritimum]CAA0260926.1 conserved hypothetical protein [Tenacibaculum maritimum]
MKHKIYYEFKDVLELTKISERTFRYRIKELKTKYKDQPDLLYKKRHSWKIHVSILFEFNPKYKITTSNKN